jgi:hypothetical protein
MDPYAAEDQNPPPRRHGCLWGCVAAAIAATVLGVAVFGFGAWYFFKGFSQDDRVQTIMAAVVENEQAKAILGGNIKLLQVEWRSYSFTTGRGAIASYVLKLTGSNGTAEVKAELDVSGAQPKIKTLQLVDGEGQTHYLVGNEPANPMMQNSI